MISDLLARLAALDDKHDGELDHDDAIDAVVGATERDVSVDERAELRSVIESGWLDE